jgi:glucose/arabinose dehydrogenase
MDCCVSGALRTAVAIIGFATLPAAALAGEAVLTGAAAQDDWRGDHPGVRRHISPFDLPAVYASSSANHVVSVVDAPAGAVPQVPQGFAVTQLVTGLENPRVIRVAPNGDIFLAETGAGRIRVLRLADGGKSVARNEVFASLGDPFGIAFYPAGPEPQWVYVATTNMIVRYPYRSGDLTASGGAQMIVQQLAPTSQGHTTRDLQFSLDGKRLFVSVGSGSNVAQGIGDLLPGDLDAWIKSHAAGAAWDGEVNRADVLVFDPDGKEGKVFATGIRNCAGLGVHPLTGDVWCVTNERDGLGDNLPPDYATRVREGAFYGWPWYYIGDHEDPRHKGARPDLLGRITAPDVLFQAHSAPLQITFYQPPDEAPGALPLTYRGDAFVALHGSWNRSRRSGYKIVRIPLKDGIPNGEYEDFVTGFVIDEDAVWGRPVGVAVASDGSLLFTEDGNGTLWRVARVAP